MVVVMLLKLALLRVTSSNNILQYLSKICSYNYPK